ncbi:Uncharacterized protein TCM_031357 [Theobroma cacao]|uniref:Cysteine-rich transmembrane domain-containing protein n=1 Tax=Theobroma cacao TaxID=3641 RepID=A0A061F7I8_THECC|nr:Uncharacterized protein TCM_031357 [Theobroma cacao]
MTQYDQNYTKDPPLPTPPNPYAAPQMAVYPTKDGQNPPGKTNSKGSGFWSGFCSGLCCYCCLDICF